MLEWLDLRASHSNFQIVETYPYSVLLFPADQGLQVVKILSKLDLCSKNSTAFTALPCSISYLDVSFFE